MTERICEKNKKSHVKVDVDAEDAVATTTTKHANGVVSRH